MAKKINKNLIPFLPLLTILFLFLFIFSIAYKNVSAAVLYMSPQTTETSVGNIVNVQIITDTQGKVINNAESYIQYPKDLLEVISIDKRNSIFSLWVEEPNFSNNIGQLTFNGGVPNPGYIGGNGNIISIIFKAKNIGNASIIFSNSAVRENDGLGTDILNGQQNASINITAQQVLPTIVPAPAPTPSSNNVSDVSIIKSSTHPEEDKWYSNNSPEFTWELSDDVIETRTLISVSPNSVPTIKYSPPISEKTTPNLSDGTYYFLLQNRTREDLSKIYRYKVNIDTTPPESFTIKFPEGNKGLNPKPIISFTTNDRESGISHYDIKINNNDVIQISPSSISNQYSLASQYPGKHTVTVKAVDKAGNSISASSEYEVEGIDTPTITEYSKEILHKEIIQIKGSTYPDSKVNIVFKQDDKVVHEENVMSNEKGEFIIISTKQLDPDVYKFTARVTDGRGYSSYETSPLPIVIKSASQNELISKIISYLSLTVLLILIIAGLIMCMVYLWYRYIVIIRRVKKESNEMEKVLDKSFEILRKDVKDHLSRLRHAQSKRSLTDEEIKFLECFEEELGEAKKVITKELKDISDKQGK